MPTVLRPSNAYIWTNCAAAPTFQERVPEKPDSDAAREGTAAAWLAESVLKNAYPDAGAALGVTHPNGWLITAEMCNYVQDYVDLLRSRGGITSAEQQVELTEFIKGTLDASTSGATVSHVLFVTDLKYGFEIVEVFENPQLIIYGAAELRRLGNPPHITRVELGIYQPRAPHPDGIYRKWEMSVAELWEHAEWIIQRGTLAMLPNPVATPGRHCKYCDALTTCFAVAQTLYAGYSVIEDQRQHFKTSDELARYLNFVDDMERLSKAAAQALKAEAETLMKSGTHIPGWHMKPRKGHRVWKVDPITLEIMTGVRPYMQTLMAPPDMERAGVPKKTVDKFARSPDIGHKLERMSDGYIRKAMSQ